MARRPLVVLSLILACAPAALPGAAGGAAVPGQRADPGIVDGSTQQRLDTARRSWKAAGMRSYSYRLTRTCFCRPLRDAKVVVRNGRPAASTPKEIADLATVPRLFRLIQHSIDGQVARLDVTYAKRGVPRTISIDGRAYVADDEVGYTIARFTPLK